MSRPAVANSGHSSAERGDFSRSDRPTTPPRGVGKVPPWLQKLEERFPLELFLQHLSCGTPPKRDTLVTSVTGAISVAGQSAPLAEDLARALGELDRELELRAGLIREQWAIRGPGLIAALGRQSGFRPSRSELEVELVLPLAGGAADLDESGTAWMEALLHDVSFQFSETLRAGWLVARLGSPSVEASVQLLLRAAEEVDWLSADPATEVELCRWLGLGNSQAVAETPGNVPPGSAGR